MDSKKSSINFEDDLLVECVEALQFKKALEIFYLRVLFSISNKSNKPQSNSRFLVSPKAMCGFGRHLVD